MDAEPVMQVTATAAVARDEPAVLEFEDFFRDVYPRLVRGLYLVTGGFAEAEEMAQEAMARAFERWTRVRAMKSPGGYVWRMALNLNRKRIRRAATFARRVLGMTPSLAGAGMEERSELMDAIAGLSRGQREALMLVAWAGFTAEEAGRVLGIGSASVRSRVHRARAALREALGDGDG